MRKIINPEALVTDDSPEPDRSAEDDAEAVRREREWHLARLRELRTERTRIDALEADLARSARTAGISWDEIAAAIGGFSAGWQAAEKYGEPEPGTAPF